ncbi:MAG TPA: diguanylate cyclase [Thermoanaerobaculia bacterium]
MPAKQSVRLALSVALVVGLAGLLALKGVVLFQSAERVIGFDRQLKPEGLLVSRVDPDLPADRGGLRPGDLILAVDGAPLADPGYTTYDEVTQRFQRGRAVVFRVQREGAVVDLRITPGVPARWGVFLLEACVALCFLAVTLLAIPPALAGDLRARLLLGYAGLTALFFVLPQGARDNIGWPWLRSIASSFVYLAGGLLMSFELHLASLITGRPAWLRRRRWVVPLCYSIGLGLGLVSWATSVIEEILILDLFPWSMLQARGMLGSVSMATNLAVVALLAAQAFRHPEPRGRNQARLVLGATIVAVLTLLAFLVASRFGLATPEASRVLFSLVSLVYSAAFFVAIFLYDLFDIELVVRRGLIYTALTTALVLVFCAAQGAGAVLLYYGLDGRGSVWVVSLATLLLGLVFAPLRRFLHRLIDRRFFPERHALRQRLVALAGELPALGKLPRMGEHLVASLREMFLARSAILLIADPETGLLRTLAATDSVSSPGRGETPLLLASEDPAIDYLRRSRGPLRVGDLATRSAAFAHRLKEIDPASLMISLLSQKKLIGALIVGPKTVGFYPAEELDLLNLLAHHVAVVFENARLFESATYESLTGLLRREAILEQLERELERAQRYGRPLTVAVADLDHFKEVNDRHGHLTGDTLLRQVSHVIAAELRSTDWIGRYGGEEFLFVLPETDILAAVVMAEKVRALVQKTVVLTEDGTAVGVTISIGLASLEEVAAGEVCVTSRDLFAAADRSLYFAKGSGRNRVHPPGAVQKLVLSGGRSHPVTGTPL